MNPEIATLIAESAAIAWLTKLVVDLVRMFFKGLDGRWVLLVAFVFGQLFSIAWNLYVDVDLTNTREMARVFIQGILAVAGAVAVTEAQDAVDKQK